MKIAVTLRWYLESSGGEKHPKLVLPGGQKIPMIRCGQCHKSPPDRTQFICMGTSDSYCHECIQDSMDDIEETDRRAQKPAQEDRKP